MGRPINRLSARTVQTITAHGRHADGGGLYLVVDAAGKRWTLLYRMAGKRREMGLGPTVSVSLATARELARGAQGLIQAGVDPIDARARPTNAKACPTFGDVASQFMADREATWRNAVHRRQWRQTLEVQAASLWSMPVDTIGVEDVLAVLRPIWTAKAETARRMRGRIELVLDAAAARHLRSGENPARWKGNLAAILPRVGKLQRGHHAAMPYAELPAFYAELAKRDATTARALAFVILTAARSGEVRGMTWEELDLKAAIWTVPRERMKSKRVHRVPLAEEAIALLPPAGEGVVFLAPRGGVLSDMAFNALLGRMGRDAYTTHGFRSSFRDWVDAETNFPADLAEAALAHQVGNEVERAYRRGDVLEKRRQLAIAWARFVASASGADLRSFTSDS